MSEVWHPVKGIQGAADTKQLLREINQKENKIRELLSSSNGYGKNQDRIFQVRYLENEVYHLWEEVRKARAKWEEARDENHGRKGGHQNDGY